MLDLRARLELDQAGQRLAVAAPAGQQGHGHRIHAPVGAKSDERIHAAALESGVQRIAGFEGKAGGLVAVAAACAHPAFVTDHDRHRLIHDLDLCDRFFLGLNQGAPRIGKGFGVRLNFLDHQPAQAGRVVQNVFQFFLFVTQLGELLLDLDRLQARELAQADFQDVFGLALREAKALHKRTARLI